MYIGHSFNQDKDLESKILPHTKSCTQFSLVLSILEVRTLVWRIINHQTWGFLCAMNPTLL